MKVLIRMSLNMAKEVELFLGFVDDWKTHNCDTILIAIMNIHWFAELHKLKSRTFYIDSLNHLREFYTV